MINKILVANWKMNGSISLVDASIDLIKNNNIVIALPSIFIAYAHCKNTELKIAAQDCSIYCNYGAHTGEISANMLADLGVEYIIIGHSERRKVSSLDSGDNIYRKLTNVIDNNITPILCIDENYKYLIDKDTMSLIKNNNDKIILAYEPITAIGTGVLPILGEISNILLDIKNNYCNVRTLYGGSVNSTNAKDILSIKEVDGVLVGSASLKLSELVKIQELIS